MKRREIVTLVLYAVVTGTAFLDIYAPLEQGRDDTWALLVLLGGAHVMLGLGVDRLWALALPAIPCWGAYFAEGGEGLITLVVLFLWPATVVLVGIGYWIGRAVGDVRTVLTAAVSACSLWPFAWAATETIKRSFADHLPAQVQAQLPLDQSLATLCDGAGNERDARVSALVRELKERPSHLVTYTYYWADDPPEQRDITVREVGEEQLRELESQSGCRRALIERIRNAL